MQQILSPQREGIMIALPLSLALIAYLIFKRYEPNSLVLLALLLGVLPALSTILIRDDFQSIWRASMAAYTAHYSIVVLCTVLYRLSPFHPLAGYPGPLGFKISRLWSARMVARGDKHLVHKALHDRYGPIVRVGPNELSFCDVNAVAATLQQPKMTKGPMYDGRRHPSWYPSLINVRYSKEHARRRQAWNRAFNSSSVKGYEPIVLARALQLVEALRKLISGPSGAPVDLSQWMDNFSSDFMGDMAFGGGFELMSDGDTNGLRASLGRTLRLFNVTGHLPWTSRLLLSPGFVKFVHILKTRSLSAKPPLNLRDFAIERAALRKKNGSKAKDLYYHLIDEDGVSGQPPSFAQIVSDGALAIVAGSDTTSTTISGIFCYLMANRNCYDRLQAEVDASFPPDEGYTLDSSKLADMPFLNAVINETLRLQPAALSGSQRAPEPGSGGKLIGDHYISEGTAVAVPTYTVHRDPRYFSPSPDKFLPDRWLKVDQKEGSFITNHAAFFPFSGGSANCAGRSLALLEIRVVVSLILQNFDMDFAENFNSTKWEQALRDYFVLTKGSLPAVLRART